MKGNSLRLRFGYGFCNIVISIIIVINHAFLRLGSYAWTLQDILLQAINVDGLKQVLQLIWYQLPQNST